MKQDYLSSNFTDIEKYIETNIEKKINQLFDVLPSADHITIPKMIYQYTVYELYSGTIQTAIDIINEITALYANKKYINAKEYRMQMLNIFIKENRKIFLGIMLVVLSFILYFIDGAEA
jgi:hypothetical protein